MALTDFETFKKTNDELNELFRTKLIFNDQIDLYKKGKVILTDNGFKKVEEEKIDAEKEADEILKDAMGKK